MNILTFWSLLLMLNLIIFKEGLLSFEFGSCLMIQLLLSCHKYMHTIHTWNSILYDHEYFIQLQPNIITWTFLMNFILFAQFYEDILSDFMTKFIDKDVSMVVSLSYWAKED